jgi:hypothetical protein
MYTTLSSLSGYNTREREEGVSGCIFVWYNIISGVMVSVPVSSEVDRKLEPWSAQAKNYKIGICCSSAKHAA